MVDTRTLVQPVAAILWLLGKSRNLRADKNLKNDRDIEKNLTFYSHELQKFPSDGNKFKFQ